jgi:hypothetical protein
MAFPIRQDLAQRLSFFSSIGNPGGYKNTSHSHTKRRFSGISNSRWTAVTNVCVIRAAMCG